MNRYKEAGVDVNAGYDLVHRIKPLVASTNRSGVMGGIGSFGGIFDLGKLGYKHPVLVSGTDGVGTKLMIAQKLHKDDTVGIDCVAMCVNDVLAQGAEPLFFLDYIACGHNDPARLTEVVKGVVQGCKQADSALIGGETAEMPDMYEPHEYDLAGFSVGIAEKENLLSSNLAKTGDHLIALPSTGVHSNGFSLIRKILFKDHEVKLSDKPAGLEGQSVGESLITPTRIYVKPILPLVKKQLLHGIAHITGGGLIENLPRIFSDDLQAVVKKGSWPVLPIFNYLKELGNLNEEDCWGTFNMGIGLVLAVAPEKVDEVKSALINEDEKFYEIGHLIKRPSDQAKIIIK